MKTKKFLSMVLALAMIFTLGVSVFAEDESDPNKFEATATVKIPTIDVAVPATAPLFINPMGFSVKIADGSAASADDEDNTKTSNKIVSPVFVIKNSSPMKLDVGVIGSVVAADTNQALAISATDIAEGDTKNSVFIYANFGVPTGDEGEEVLAEATYSADNNKTLALTTKAPKDPSVVGTIAAGGEDPTYYAFQFLGNCNPNAKLEWNAGDKVTVTLVFSFKPNMSASTGS